MMSNTDALKEEYYFFNTAYYLEQNPDVAQINMDPLQHYMSYGWKEGRNPSKHFDTQKYLDEHPELLPINMNPFLHLSFAYNNSISPVIDFPTQCVETFQEFKALEKGKEYKRIILMASFIGDGIIPAHTLYLLTKLKKCSDAIIMVCDNPILESELKKISTLVNYASFTRHEEYDFGSYKRALDYLAKSIDLKNVDEVVFCNDSCVGPVYPFEEMFMNMKEKDLDFWGLTISPEIFTHIQSYFMVFNNKVLCSKVFQDYFTAVKKEKTRTDVILKYELPLTNLLHEHGFKYNTYIQYPSHEQLKNGILQHKNLTTAPVYLLERRCPLIKLKHFYDKSLNYDGLERTLELVKEANSRLGDIVESFLQQRLQNTKITQKNKVLGDPKKALMYIKLNEEINNYHNKNPKKTHIFPESKIVHKYLDGLNGIEIGAASHNSFGLDKTGAYANIDFRASHGNFWQGEQKDIAPAKVNIVASGDDLPFKDEVLDYVISSHAIEHFFDPIKTIEEWFRVVKKDGYVVIIAPHRLRTFDRNRENTSLEELLARHKNIISPEDYAFKNELDESGSLVSDCLILMKDKVAPEGYDAYVSDDAFPLHFSVWDTESFVTMCRLMKWNLVEILDIDDKVGNGFLIILKK